MVWKPKRGRIPGFGPGGSGRVELLAGHDLVVFHWSKGSLR
ncbi:hypothetical protein HMPREF9577_01433 [Cutibacterium acnes HL110PA3]|nr:hypothetical protein HMPREF9577_01433 [Cutibacterium acnes HL110PA3]